MIDDIDLTETLRKLRDIGRELTYEEYRLVKSGDWYEQKKVFRKHLGESGFAKYRTAIVRHGKSKYPTYQELYKVHNSKLGQALK